MNTRMALLVSFVAIVLLAGGVMFLSKKETKQKTTPTSQTPTTAPTSNLPKENVVMLTANGFSPKSITIKTGEAVRFTNKEVEKATVNSDDHPNHTKYPELNLGEFAKDQTLVHIFAKKGTYTYHDHYNPKNKGIIIVQ